MNSLFAPQSRPEPSGLKRERIPCSRCAVPCVINGPKNADAMLLRYATKATKPKHGVCVNCGFRLWVETIDVLKDILSRDTGPEAFRLPHVQEMLRSVMRVGKADADFEELNFDEIVANWYLPLK